MDYEKFVINCGIDLLRKYAFYGHIMQQLPKVFVNNENCGGINTLAVGKTRSSEIQTKLFINTDYLDKLYKEHGLVKLEAHLKEVMKHEIHHLIFGHLTIDLPDKNRLAIACECSVNSYINRDLLINESSDKTKKVGVFPEDFGLPRKESVYFYYKELENNSEYKNMSSQSIVKISIGLNSDKDSGDESKDDSVVIDSHELWEIVKSDPVSEEMIKDIIRQSVDICKKTDTWGDVPAEIKEEVKKAFVHKKEVIPWQVILKQFIASSSENILGYTMRRRSKRFGIRPGTKKEDVLNLGILIDTSASISNEMINLFFGELDWIAKTNSSITIFECDTQINREYPYSEWDGMVEGRGGTDIEVAVKEINDRRFDALIAFTDMETPNFKESYNIPCMWVINNSCYRYISDMPYQEGIFLKLSDDGESFEVFDE